MDLNLLSKNLSTLFFTNRFNSGTGHYTQIVWAKTHKIGCGYTAYRGGNSIKKLIVCNYGAAGNFINAPMYQDGQACSNCPENTTCSKNYPGLCTVPGETGLSPANTNISNIIKLVPTGSEGNFDTQYLPYSIDSNYFC